MTIPSLVLVFVLAPPPPKKPPAKPAEPAKSAEPAKTSDAAPSTAGPAQGFIDAGLAAFRKQRFAQAEAEFSKAEEADPQSPAAAFYLGYAMYKRHEKTRNAPEKTKALELFSKAFSLDPAFRPVWGGK
jgi:tetratricopeptide (TPR) repeat protein